MEKNVYDLPFTKKELEMLNLTPAQLDLLLDANATAKTTDMLPRDPKAVEKRIDKEFPNDIAGTLQKLTDLAKSDPKFVNTLVAMNELFAEVKIVSDEPQVSKVEKVSVKNEAVQEGLDELKKVMRAKK